MSPQSLGNYKPHLSEVRDSPNFTSMPDFPNCPRGLEHSTSDDTLTSLDRYLRPNPNPVPLEKMLTPVQERPAAEYDREHSSLSDEADQDIIPTLSDKLDSSIFSRSVSGFASPPTWQVGEMESDRNSIRDSTSILSSGYGTPPPRSILNSTNSMEMGEMSHAQNMEDLAKALENHEEKISSQGSDDSSTFSESAPTTHYGRGQNFNNVASPQGSGSFSFSSAEGTPVRTMSETRKRHPARQQTDTKKQLVSSVSDSTTRVGNSRPRLSPYSSSSHSSVSGGATNSSQSSLGEEGMNSDASERRSRHLMKYGKYEKYERYERYETRDRSKSLETAPDFMTKKLDVSDLLSESEPSQVLTQDSNGTLTDGNLESTTETLTEVELSSSHSVASVDSFYQNVNGQTPVICATDQYLKSEHLEDINDEKDEGGVSDVVQDVQKTHDSGIDDTSSPVYKNNVNARECSICDNNDLPLQDREPKPPTSYKMVFTSRDSMLTESPDTDSLNDDYVNSKATHHTQKQPVQQRKRSPTLERESRATSEVSESSIGSPAHVELIIEDGKPARLYEKEPQLLSSNFDDTLRLDDIGPELSRVSDDEDSILELERSGSSSTHAAPRSLEGPAFSRYARVPIRSTESKSHIRAADNPLYDAGSSLKQRASSLNDLDEVSPTHSPDVRDARETRATSESRSDKSLTLNLSGSSIHSKSGGLPQSSSAIDLQASSGNRVEVLRGKAMGGSLRLEKKPKKGKGLVSKLKPALRVLKIAPSSGVEGKKSRGKESKLHKSRTHHSESLDSPTSPMEYLSPVPRPYEEVRRMRMMSPEVMAVQDVPPPKAMRRSQSSDDILDHSGDSFTDDSDAATKVGPVYVIPEPMKSKRRRFLGFQSKTKDRSKSRESSQSPVVLVDIQHNTRRVSVEPIMNTSTNGNGTLEVSQQKSPKLKRRRLPHFV